MKIQKKNGKRSNDYWMYEMESPGFGPFYMVEHDDAIIIFKNKQEAIYEVEDMGGEIHKVIVHEWNHDSPSMGGYYIEKRT